MVFSISTTKLSIFTVIADHSHFNPFQPSDAMWCHTFHLSQSVPVPVQPPHLQNTQELAPFVHMLGDFSIYIRA
jgi:hypothetical protein